MKRLWLLILINLLIIAIALIFVVPAYGQGEAVKFAELDISSIDECGKVIHVVLKDYPAEYITIIYPGEGHFQTVDVGISKGDVQHFEFRPDGREVIGGLAKVPSNWDSVFTVACSPPGWGLLDKFVLAGIFLALGAGLVGHLRDRAAREKASAS